MKYISVCSGIEAATCAWHHMGWEPVAFSEIEKFPSAVLAHHYPSVPNWGDMTKFKEWPDANVDVLVGGTPCQSFSVAGLRKGLDDPRGNLMLTFGSIAQRYRPKWLVWENVPGVLSSNGGRDFGSFLGMLGQLGYGFAYRVLDAQYFGVAQRRRRVFVVGYLGDWHRAAAVLFERHSLSGHPAPSRQARERVAKCLTTGIGKRYDPETDTMIPTNQTRWWDGGDIAATLTTKSDDQRMPDKANAQLVMQPALTFKVRGGCEGGGKGYLGQDEQAFTLATTQDQWLAHPIGFHHNAQACQLPTAERDTSISDALTCSQQAAVAQPFYVVAALTASGRGVERIGESRGQDPVVLQTAMQVRRLTPVECERLQGFLDGYTRIPNWSGWRAMDADETPDECTEQGLQVKQNKKTGR